MLSTPDSTSLQSEASKRFAAEELQAGDEATVDFDTIKRDGPVAPGGTGTLTNFLCESNDKRAKAGARMWGWMYEDVEDITTTLPSPSPSIDGTTPPSTRTRSHTTPARIPEGQPAPQGGGKQAGTAVSFTDDEPAPEPDPESASRTHQP